MTDYWEILLVSVSSFCQHLPIVLKEFDIVYYVTIAPYNSKSNSRYHVSLKRARVGVFSKGTGLVLRFISGSA